LEPRRDILVDAAGRVERCAQLQPKQPGLRMHELVAVGTVDRIGPGRAMSVAVVGESIAVFNVDGKLYALDDACILCGTSLAIGLIDCLSVLCAGCDWRYDVTSGCVHGIPGLRIDTFAVAVVDEHVMIDAMPMPHVTHPAHR
jgi:nitrite reductase/ring-hydroxylating ferredoxin subunit